jgi:hypothetical protein
MRSIFGITKTKQNKTKHKTNKWKQSVTVFGKKNRQMWEGQKEGPSRNKPANSVSTFSSHILDSVLVCLLYYFSADTFALWLAVSDGYWWKCHSFGIFHTLWFNHHLGFVGILNSNSKFLQERLSYWYSLATLVNPNANIHNCPGCCRWLMTFCATNSKTA